MGIKSEQSGQPSLLSGDLHRLGDHRLMADMHAIENTQRQMQGLPERGKIIKVVAYQHPAAITSACPAIKLRPLAAGDFLKASSFEGIVACMVPVLKDFNGTGGGKDPSCLCDWTGSSIERRS